MVCGEETVTLGVGGFPQGVISARHGARLGGWVSCSVLPTVRFLRLG